LGIWEALVTGCPQSWHFQKSPSLPQ
jgi:hypothetical protein